MSLRTPTAPLSTHTHCRYLARAGWAVWYAEDSQFNTHGGLTGPLHISYRGELRAILHAFQTAGIPTWTKSDCKAEVDLVSVILRQEDIDTAELTDGDLWQKLQILSTSQTQRVFLAT